MKLILQQNAIIMSWIDGNYKEKVNHKFNQNVLNTVLQMC